MKQLKDIITEKLRLTKHIQTTFTELNCDNMIVKFPCKVYIRHVNSERDKTFILSGYSKYINNDKQTIIQFYDKNGDVLLEQEWSKVIETFKDNKETEAYKEQYGTVIIKYIK